MYKQDHVYCTHGSKLSIALDEVPFTLFSISNNCYLIKFQCDIPQSRISLKSYFPLLHLSTQPWKC